MENKKILIAIIPYFGHVNPVLGVAHELVRRKAKVIFYSTKEFEEKINLTGAEFREYVDFPVLPSAKKESAMYMSSKNTMGFAVSFMMDAGIKYLPELIQVCDKEVPDLIIYDTFAIYSKYLINYLKYRHEKERSTIPLPKTLLFSQAFVTQDNVYPSGKALEIILSSVDENFPKIVEGLVEKQKEINYKYKLNVQDAFQFAVSTKDDLSIVSIMPELHPHSELFDKSYKFVGCCVSHVRNQEITLPKLQSILSYFKPANPLKSADSTGSLCDKNYKLVYVSLGTVFNYNTYVFEEIIEAINTFDEENTATRSDVTRSQLMVIISLGNISYESFQNKIENENYNVPNNILLLPSAPQIEILERASLFVTHCGMNSTSEAIHFGVPLICLPISTDQPLVAHRVADELNLGINFDYTTVKSHQIRTAMHTIFKDRSYLERMLEFSKLSRKYNGVVDAADIIEKYLE